MNPAGNKGTIYLAGGFHSGWQALAAKKLAGFRVLDPSSHNILETPDYTRWDLDAIRMSDVVFANMEATNPGGYSLALEVGFAKALGKRIVLVDGLGLQPRSRYFDMVRQCADEVYESIDEALELFSADSKVFESEWESGQQ
jgi:nucleoside 2-deoxyribosyltransferase